MSDAIREVMIPARDEHQGIETVKVLLFWFCPECRAKRGRIRKGLSYDGSLRMDVDTWKNPCGHVDKYPDVRKEAAANGLNKVCAL